MYEQQTEEFREQKGVFGFDIDNDADDEIVEITTPKSLFDNELEKGEAEMQTLGICEQTETQKRNGFWRRQFQTEPTVRQKWNDWFFGVVMPVVCIFFDPMVFTTNGGILSSYKPFAYSSSFISIMLMVAWLLWREKLGSFNALIAGFFFAASAVSLAIGIVLVPFSLLGLIFFIGALGFTPLFTSVIFLRNGVRAVRAAELVLPKRLLVYSVLLSALASAVIPYVFNVEINRSIERIKTGDAKTIREEGRKLWLVSPLVPTGSLARRYYMERDAETHSEEMKAIVEVIHDLTGKDIEVRRFSFLD